MLTDEQIISIRRNRDGLVKLIDLIRLTCDEEYTFIVFRNLHKIRSMEEKTLYLLFVYIKNCDEDYLKTLIDTDIISNNTINEFLCKGISVNELNSDIVKKYLMENVSIDIITLLKTMSDKYKEDKKNNDTNHNCVDYNLNHLDKENYKDIELRNIKLKRKIRRKIIYDKYQRGF